MKNELGFRPRCQRLGRNSIDAGRGMPAQAMPAGGASACLVRPKPACALHVTGDNSLQQAEARLSGEQAMYQVETSRNRLPWMAVLFPLEHTQQSTNADI